MFKYGMNAAAFSFAILFSAYSFAEPMYGVLMVVKGAVKVQSPGKPAIDAKVGGRVVEGDTVVTLAEARAKIVMSDRNVINVNPDTQVAIAKYENDPASGKKNVELNLLKGKVRNNVEQTYDGEKNKFLIKTPTAVAGVRGTQFLASYDTATKMTSVVTFKGAVLLASVNAQGLTVGAPVLVKKGEMTQAAPNMPPEPPKAMPKEEMKKADAEPTREAASEPSGSSGKGDSAASTAPPPPPGPSMIDAKDMDVGLAKEIKDFRSPAAAPPPLATPPPVMPTPNPIVKEIIRDSSGKTRVNVRPVAP